jgi:hypothetical protein
MDGSRVSEDDEGRLRILAALAAAVMAGWAIETASQTAGASGLRLFYAVTVGLSGLVLCAGLVARAFGRQRSRALWFLVAAIPLDISVGRVLLLTAGRSRESAWAELSPRGFLAVLGICLLLAFATMGYFVERPKPPVRRHPTD